MGFKFVNKDQKLQQAANYAPGKRQLSKIYWYLLLIMILSPFIYLGYKIFTDTFLMSANGHVMFGEVTIRAPASSYVDQIMLDTGDSFVKGQSIIQLSSPQLLSQLRSLDGELIVLNEKKKKMLDDNSEIEQLLIAKKEAEKYVLETQYYLQIWENLRAQGKATIDSIQKSLFDLNTANQNLKAIDRDIAKIQINKNLQSEEYFDKSIRETEAKIKMITTSIELLNIKAPEQGNIAKVSVHENEYVKEGQDLAVIVVKRNIYIIAYVESKFLSEKLAADQEVNIIFPDGAKIKGKVTATPIFAESDPSKSSIVQSDKNKIMVKILPKEEIPPKYRIAGLPVDILFY